MTITASWQAPDGYNCAQEQDGTRQNLHVRVLVSGLRNREKWWFLDRPDNGRLASPRGWPSAILVNLVIG